MVPLRPLRPALLVLAKALPLLLRLPVLLLLLL